MLHGARLEVGLNKVTTFLQKLQQSNFESSSAPKDEARTAAEPEARECSRHDKEKQACDVKLSTAACGSCMLSPSE